MHVEVENSYSCSNVVKRKYPLKDIVNKNLFFYTKDELFESIRESNRKFEEQKAKKLNNNDDSIYKVLNESELE